MNDKHKPTDIPSSEPVGKERREYTRYNTSLAIDYSDGEHFLFSYIDNISEMGIFIRSDEPLPIGTELRLKFGSPDEKLSLDGEVVWHNPVKLGSDNLNPGMGVRFNSLTPELREKVVALIRTVAYLDPTKKN